MIRSKLFLSLARCLSRCQLVPSLEGQIVSVSLLSLTGWCLLSRFSICLSFVVSSVSVHEAHTSFEDDFPPMTDSFNPVIGGGGRWCLFGAVVFWHDRLPGKLVGHPFLWSLSRSVGESMLQM